MKKPAPNILFIPSWYPTKENIQNGVFIQKHAKAAAIANNVTVLFAHAFAQPYSLKRTNGKLVENISAYKRTNSKWLNQLKLLRLYLKHVSLFRKADIIHLHVLSKRSFFGCILAFLYNKPLIVSEHWSGYQNSLSLSKKLIKRMVFWRASYILPVSNFLQKLMEDKKIRGNFKVVGNIVKEQKDKRLADTPFKFLIVADLRDNIKNISSVIQIFKQKNLMNEVLHIIGDGPDKDFLESLCENEKNISLLGEMSNEKVIKEISNYHAVIINSRIETFSVVALESLAANRPLIYTKCGGPQEIIPKDCGIAISPDNSEELYNAITSLKANYKLYQHKNYSLAIADFKENRIAQEFSKIYTALLSE